MIFEIKRLPSILWLPFTALLCMVRCAPEERYYTEEDFEKVNKADVHVHIFTERSDFAEQAERDNFKLITIAHDPHSRMDSVRKEHRFSVLQHKEHPGTVAFVTAFSMEGWGDPGWQEKTMAWLDSAIHDGAVGVKIWKNIGMSYRDSAGNLVMVDDPAFDPVFNMLAERKITLFGHLGEPKNCWLPLEEMTTNNDRRYFSEHPEYHMHRHPDMPSYEAQIAARDNMLAKNGALTFVGAHVGSLEWNVDSLAARLDRFPNMAVDLAARMGQIFYQTRADRKKVRDFFIRYQDRVLYATDLSDRGRGDASAMQQQIHEVWRRDWQFFTQDKKMESNLIEGDFQGLRLPQQVVDKIFYKNAQKWFGIFPD